MDGNPEEGGRRAELYVRSLVPDTLCHRQDEVIDRLIRLEDDGVLTDWTVHVWGKQGPATPADARTDAGVFALNRISVFQEWAERNDRSLASAFEVREVDSGITGQQYRAIVFPAVLLAEYDGNALRCVTPHADADGTVTTVTDRLTQLAMGRDDTFESMARAAATNPPPQFDGGPQQLHEEEYEKPVRSN